MDEDDFKEEFKSFEYEKYEESDSDDDFNTWKIKKYIDEQIDFNTYEIKKYVKECTNRHGFIAYIIGIIVVIVLLRVF